MRSPELTNDDLHEAVMFLKELCSFARTLEMSPNSAFSESTFFKVCAFHVSIHSLTVFLQKLLDMGLLSAITRCLAKERYDVRAAATDVLALFVEHNPFTARYAILLSEVCTLVKYSSSFQLVQRD